MSLEFDHQEAGLILGTLRPLIECIRIRVMGIAFAKNQTDLSCVGDVSHRKRPVGNPRPRRHAKPRYPCEHSVRPRHGRL